MNKAKVNWYDTHCMVFFSQALPENKNDNHQCHPILSRFWGHKKWLKCDSLLSQVACLITIDVMALVLLAIYCWNARGAGANGVPLCGAFCGFWGARCVKQLKREVHAVWSRVDRVEAVRCQKWRKANRISSFMEFDSKNIQKYHRFARYIGCGPLTVTVTSRIMTFLVGDPYKPSFTTVTDTVRGPYPKDTCGVMSKNQTINKKRTELDPAWGLEDS